MESSDNSSSNSSQTSPGNSPQKGFINIDLPWIFGRIQDVMTNPNGCWEKIKSEGLVTKELFGRYLIPLAALSAICGFIGYSLIGISFPLGTWRVPFFSGLIFQIVSFVASLASFFVSAFILEKLAGKFDTQVSQEQALRYVGFAATPSLLAGVLSLSPGSIFSIIQLFLSLYALYLLWVGFQPMTSVPQERKVAYFATWIVCSFVSLIIVFGIVSSIFAPVMPTDFQDMQKFQENIQKLMPNAR